MADSVSARLTPVHGRRFGLTMGGAFLVMGMVVAWRGHPVAAIVIGALGVALALAGLALPTRLDPVERAWMALAHAMSKVTTPIIMGAMYLLVITPIGAARRLLGGNPLVHVEMEKSFWKPRLPGHRRSNLRRQF